MPPGKKKADLIFDVIIPTLNSTTIDRTIASLLTQQTDQIEYNIIVVGRDDQRRIKPHKNVLFIETDQPCSPAKARNLGVQASAADFLAFTDSDCIVSKTWLSSLADALLDHPGAIIGGGVNIEGTDTWTFIDNLATFHDALEHLPQGERDQLPSLNLAMPRAAFEEVGGFDERFPQAAGEDSDLTFRLKRAGYRLIFTPNAKINHQPARNTFSQFIWHAYIRGRYSLLVDPRYLGEVGLPRILRNPIAFFLASPVMSLYSSLKIYIKPKMYRYLVFLPLIYLAKMSWCWGAFLRVLGPDPIVDPPGTAYSLETQNNEADRI